MNPLTPNGNTSQEAARAKELASLVHKTKLGSHTEHKDEVRTIKTFDTTQGGHAMPGSTHAVPQPLQSTSAPIPAAASSLALEAKRILQQTKLPTTEKPPSLPRLSEPAPMGAATYATQERDTIERVNQNQSLASQSAVLHTLSQDVESLVKDRKVSMVRAVALESDATHATTMPQMAQNATRRVDGSRSVLPILTILCVVCAVGIVGTAWYIRNTRIQQPIAPVARYDSGLLFYEHTQPFDGTDLTIYELLGGLAHLRDNVPSSLGSFTLVDVFTKAFDATKETRSAAPTTLEDFMMRGGLNPPAQLKRTLTGEYMILIHQGDAPRPVILMRANEPDAAFAGMLMWEQQLPQRLSPFFPLGTLVLASAQPQFKDVSFNNIDARVLYDGGGSVVVMYALLERDVLALTNSQATMEEIASRLHTQRLKK